MIPTLQRLRSQHKQHDTIMPSALQDCCDLCHLMLEVMRSALLQGIVTGPVVNMSPDIPRGAAADPSAKPQADFIKDQSKAAIGSAILPVGIVHAVLPAPLHHSSGVSEAMEQESGDGAKEACVHEAVPDHNMQVRY
jgi:hypothetical protein